MISRWRTHLLSPHVWMTAAVFCFGASIVISYHQDQVSAAGMLAAKDGDPTEVLVQDFVADRHTNMAGQVHVVGQLGRDGAIRIDVGAGGVSRMVTARAVFPVGPDTLPLAQQHMAAVAGQPRRPIARADVEAYATYLAGLARLAEMPVAVLIEEDGSATTGAVALGDGDIGPLIEIKGETVAGSSLRENVRNAFAETGIPLIPEVPLLSPMTSQAPVLITDDSLTRVRHALAVAGAVMAGLGFLCMSGVPSVLRRDREGDDEVAPVAALSAVFQRRTASRRSTPAETRPRSAASG